MVDSAVHCIGRGGVTDLDAGMEPADGPRAVGAGRTSEEPLSRVARTRRGGHCRAQGDPASCRSDVTSAARQHGDRASRDYADSTYSLLYPIRRRDRDVGQTSHAEATNWRCVVVAFSYEAACRRRRRTGLALHKWCLVRSRQLVIYARCGSTPAELSSSHRETYGTSRFVAAQNHASPDVRRNSQFEPP